MPDRCRKTIMFLQIRMAMCTTGIKMEISTSAIIKAIAGRQPGIKSCPHQGQLHQPQNLLKNQPQSRPSVRQRSLHSGLQQNRHLQVALTVMYRCAIAQATVPITLTSRRTGLRLSVLHQGLLLAVAHEKGRFI